MRTLVLKLFTIAALTAASSAVASAQGPAAADPAEPQQAQAAPAPSRQALIEQEQADKADELEALRCKQGRAALPAVGRGHRGRLAEVASLLRQRLFGRRVHARGGPKQLRQRLQLHRRARQLHDHRLQACRGGVRRAAHVQPARTSVGPRRVARGDPGRLLRHRDRTARRTIAPTTCSNSPTPRRS